MGFHNFFGQKIIWFICHHKAPPESPTLCHVLQFFICVVVCPARCPGTALHTPTQPCSLTYALPCILRWYKPSLQSPSSCFKVIATKAASLRAATEELELEAGSALRPPIRPIVACTLPNSSKFEGLVPMNSVLPNWKVGLTNVGYCTL